jgi:hypothetical protein
MFIFKNAITRLLKVAIHFISGNTTFWPICHSLRLGRSRIEKNNPIPFENEKLLNYL